MCRELGEGTIMCAALKLEHGGRPDRVGAGVSVEARPRALHEKDTFIAQCGHL